MQDGGLTGTAGEAPGGGSGSSGCGCRTVPSPPRDSFLAGLGLVGLCLARRRRPPSVCRKDFGTRHAPDWTSDLPRSRT
jgi:MYXO-CTERM domain-containing protein